VLAPSISSRWNKQAMSTFWQVDMLFDREDPDGYHDAPANYPHRSARRRRRLARSKTMVLTEAFHGRRLPQSNRGDASLACTKAS
jgi:hypothetical protein